MRKRLSAFLLAVLLMFVTQAEAYGTEGRDYITVLDTVEATVPLEGKLMTNVVLISVVMPATVDIVVRVYEDQTFRQLYAPANLYVTSRSDCPVELSLTAVQNADGKLNTFDAFLSACSTDGRDTLAGERVGPLTDGPYGATLGRLEGLPEDGILISANRLRLVLEGAAKVANTAVGDDGESFAFATTLKVSTVPDGP